MARIHVLSEQVANKIAAGEVVERPASVVKELLENALDAGATRIRIAVEAGGRKLIQVTDNGQGMVRDDAILAFERHATSKIKDADDLLNIATLGFRGEGLPSIAAVSRITLETRAAGEEAGTRLEIAGGRIQNIEETGLPAGTSVTMRDLFFNTPARRKFLKAESTELAHIATLVTQYALAHPEKHIELHSATNAMLMASPVAGHAERLYQVLGKETLDQMIPIAAELDLARAGLPEPPPWRRDAEYVRPEPGQVRLHGFVSKPEVQKLNRNSIFLFVNRRLIRDRLIQHALTEAYRNILPPALFPVVLLFLEMPPAEVDCNVHPAKTEVRFRQSSAVHDFLRDAVRAALLQARPVPQFRKEITAQPTAGQALTPGAGPASAAGSDFALSAPSLPPASQRIDFSGGIAVEADATVPAARMPAVVANGRRADRCAGVIEEAPGPGDLSSLASLKALGQIRESFILAVNQEGLWIIDQHVAHERILFERVLRQREARQIEVQRLLLPLLVELSPGQQAMFQELAEELRASGFEVEPFGSRTIAVKSAPAGVDAGSLERLLHELLDPLEREQPAESVRAVGHRIAASIACHAAIKVNTPLEPNKMDWLLAELARTECPMTCPHGRPVVLRYSLADIQRAFKRI